MKQNQLHRYDDSNSIDDSDGIDDSSSIDDSDGIDDDDFNFFVDILNISHHYHYQHNITLALS